MTSIGIRRCFCIVSTFLLSATLAVADSVDDLLAKAAPLDQKFQAAQALSLYQAAAKLEPANGLIQARIARQYRHLMYDAADPAKKIELGRTALRYSERAAALAPANAESQLSVAISLGKLLPLLGKKEQAQAPYRIKSSVDRALALDPQNDTAWDILGRWNRVLAGMSSLKRTLAGAMYGSLPKGSNTEAELALQKAIQLNPNRPMHYIELGRVYAQEGRKEEARRSLTKGLALPDMDKDDPENKAHAREALAAL